MQRKVYGPYREPRGWRIVVRTGTGPAATKQSFLFPTEAEALRQVGLTVKELGVKTVGQLVDDFLLWKGTEGAKASTLVTDRYRLEGMLADVRLVAVKDLTTARCEVLYKAYQEGRRPDTHQGALSVVKSCFEYARKHAKAITVNPWDDIDPRGRKAHGKPQLKKDDTRKLYRWLVANAVTEDRACAALMALALGLRAHEVVGRTADHLDENGTELMVTESKTRAGVRNVKLPKVLQEALARRAELRSGKLLPYRPAWVREATEWCCKRAGVTVVCAQALRGMYATATLDSGLDPNAVARSLGHTNVSITRSAYAAQGAGRSSHVEQLTSRLEGEHVHRPN